MRRDGSTGSPAKSAKVSQAATKVTTGSAARGDEPCREGEHQTRTKKYYIEHIAQMTGVNRSAVKQVLQSLLDEMMDDLAEGHRIEFRDFGVFEVKERAERRAQNPRTLERVLVPKRRAVKFKPGLGMKRLFDDGAKVIRLVETKPAKPSKPAKAARREEQERVERPRTRETHMVNGSLAGGHR